MSAPKKPEPRPACALAPAPDALPLDLTQAEINLLNSFRGTDDHGRDFIGKIALGQVRIAAQYRAAPSLRLIVGGAA